MTADLVVDGQVPLAPLGTLGVGGPARWFATADSPAVVAAAHHWARERGSPLAVLGGGSNVVVADRGVDGLVLRIQLRGVTFERRSGMTYVEAAAGEPWDDLVAACVARGLRGLECLSGIPGFVGGTPIQNVGAYGQEVGEVIDAVTVFDRVQSELRTLAGADCGFGYRSSRFKAADSGRFIVCSVTYRLAAGPPTIAYPDVKAHIERRRRAEPTVADVRAAVLTVRRAKGMVVDPADPETRSVGSFFMNPVMPEAERARIAAAAGEPVPGFAMAEGQVKVPAAWLIERAGFARGHADGAVGISTRHTLAIVNRGGAAAADVLRLAAGIKRRVLDRFGVPLRPEPVFLGFEENRELAYLTGSY